MYCNKRYIVKKKWKLEIAGVGDIDQKEIYKYLGIEFERK